MQVSQHTDFERLRLPDGGQIYAETDLNSFIVEPWNAATAFIFVILVAYWGWKIWGKMKVHGFMSLVLPILLIGGIGGTLFHGFRVSRWFLLMDWLPIMVLTMGASAYFLWKVIPRWYAMAGMIILGYTLEWLNFKFIGPPIAVNVSYGILGLLVLTPIFLVLRMNKFRDVLWVLLSLLSFGLAVFFRSVDSWNLLPMGTHFLWHVFGALACHFIFQFTFLLHHENKDRASTIRV